MKVEEYLRYHTNVGDLVEFTNGGWRIGITYVDHEDLEKRLKKGNKDYGK